MYNRRRLLLSSTANAPCHTPRASTLVPRCPCPPRAPPPIHPPPPPPLSIVLGVMWSVISRFQLGEISMDGIR
jgi:hypothetical protein